MQQTQTVTIGELFISRRQFSLYDEMVMRGNTAAYEMSKIFTGDIIRETDNRTCSMWDSEDDLQYETIDLAGELSAALHYAKMIAAGYHKNGIGRTDYTIGLVEGICDACHN